MFFVGKGSTGRLRLGVPGVLDVLVDREILGNQVVLMVLVVLVGLGFRCFLVVRVGLVVLLVLGLLVYHPVLADLWCLWFRRGLVVLRLRDFLVFQLLRCDPVVLDLLDVRGCLVVLVDRGYREHLVVQAVQWVLVVLARRLGKVCSLRERS